MGQQILNLSGFEENIHGNDHGPDLQDAIK
jgi:hypothetical protein